MLADNEKPIVAFIGRLDPQKGLELVRHAIFYALEQRRPVRAAGLQPGPGHQRRLLGPQAHAQRQPRLPPGDRLRRGAGAPDLCRRRHDAGAEPVRTLRPDAADRDALRHHAGRARRSAAWPTRCSTRTTPTARCTSATAMSSSITTTPGSESALSRAIACYYHHPDHFRELMQNAHAQRLLMEHPGTGLPEHLRLYPPQVANIAHVDIASEFSRQSHHRSRLRRPSG